ncbi:MATE family efflux transporter [Campylobacter rectus]
MKTVVFPRAHRGAQPRDDVRAAAIAANAMGSTIAMFQVLPGMAMGMGLTVVISRCVGAGDFEQAKFYAKKVLIAVYIAQLVSTVLVLLLLEPVLRLYSLSPEAAAMTTQIVWWHGVMMALIWPLAYTLPVVFRAAAARYPMWVSASYMFACRIALAYFFSLALGLGMLGTWYAMFADLAVKPMLFTRRYLNGKSTKFKAI